MIKINLAPPDVEPTERWDPTAALSTWLAAAICLLPFATFVPLYGWPPGIAAGNSPLVVLHLLGLLLVCGVIWREDRLLAVFAAYIALDALRAPAPALGRAWQMADAVALGALLYVWARRIPEVWAARIRLALGVSAIVQTGIAAYQWVGGLAWMDGSFREAGTMVGTLGNDTWLGAYLAICGAVGPVWSIPFAVAGLLLAYNRLGLAALIVGLIVRFWCHRQPPSWYVSLSIPILTALFYVMVLTKTLDSVYARLHVWQTGLVAWWEHAILFGRGPGVWAWDMRQFELPEFFVQMHSEPIQLLYETGLVGLGLIVAWAIARRRDLVANPAAWALAVLCAAFFPFHVAQVAGPALIAVAVWAKTQPDPPAPRRLRCANAQW